MNGVGLSAFTEHLLNWAAVSARPGALPAPRVAPWPARAGGKAGKLCGLAGRSAFLIKSCHSGPPWDPPTNSAEGVTMLISLRRATEVPRRQATCPRSHSEMEAGPAPRPPPPQASASSKRLHVATANSPVPPRPALFDICFLDISSRLNSVVLPTS